MSKVVKIATVLLYYDFPQIFVAEDEIGCLYVCMVVKNEMDVVKYISVAISRRRRMDLIANKVDLLDAFTEPEQREFYELDVNYGDEEELMLKEAPYKSIPGSYLPDRGIVFDLEPIAEDIDQQEILSDLIEKDNLVTILSISDRNDSKSVPIQSLSFFLSSYQKLVESVYKKTIVNKNPANKKILLDSRNYEMQASRASQGSFKIHMFSKGQKDLFGDTFLSEGFKNVSIILNDFENEDEYYNRIKPFKGHAINSLKKLTKVIMEENIIISHSWAAPSDKYIHKFIINEIISAKIYSALTKKEELSEEIKIITGEFVQIDIHRKTWKLFDRESNAEYHGTSDINFLEGIIIRTKTYTLECLEITEGNIGIDQEKVRYFIRSVKEENLVE